MHADEARLSCLLIFLICWQQLLKSVEEQWFDKEKDPTHTLGSDI